MANPGPGHTTGVQGSNEPEAFTTQIVATTMALEGLNRVIGRLQQVYQAATTAGAGAGGALGGAAARAGISTATMMGGVGVGVMAAASGLAAKQARHIMVDPYMKALEYQTRLGGDWDENYNVGMVETLAETPFLGNQLKLDRNLAPWQRAAERTAGITGAIARSGPPGYSVPDQFIRDTMTYLHAEELRGFDNAKDVERIRLELSTPRAGAEAKVELGKLVGTMFGLNMNRF